jgi:hypothetical protein
MPLDFPASPTNGQTYTYSGRTWSYSTTTGAWGQLPASLDDIVTASADLTLSAASHQGKYIRLTKPGSTQTITVTTPGFDIGATVYFRRATSQTIQFAAGGDTINNGSNLSSVPNGGNFALKYLGTNTWDFV